MTWGRYYDPLWCILHPRQAFKHLNGLRETATQLERTIYNSAILEDGNVRVRYLKLKHIITVKGNAELMFRFCQDRKMTLEQFLDRCIINERGEVKNCALWKGEPVFTKDRFVYLSPATERLDRGHFDDEPEADYA